MTSLMISSDRPANAVPKLSDLVLLQLLQFTWGGWVGGGGGAWTSAEGGWMGGGSPWTSAEGSPWTSAGSLLIAKTITLHPDRTGFPPCASIIVGLFNFSETPSSPQRAQDRQSPPLTEVVTLGPITVLVTDARWQHGQPQSSSAGTLAWLTYAQRDLFRDVAVRCCRSRTTKRVTTLDGSDTIVRLDLATANRLAQLAGCPTRYLRYSD